MRVRGDVEVARRELVDRLAAIDPNMSEVSSLQTLALTETYILGTVVLAHARAGIAGVAADGVRFVQRAVVSRRATHARDRRADGARRDRRSVGGLVLRQCARPVGIGLVVGCTLTAGLGAALLATPAAEQIGAIVQLFDPVAYGASLLCIVAACAGGGADSGAARGAGQSARGAPARLTSTLARRRPVCRGRGAVLRWAPSMASEKQRSMSNDNNKSASAPRHFASLLILPVLFVTFYALRALSGRFAIEQWLPEWDTFVTLGAMMVVERIYTYRRAVSQRAMLVRDIASTLVNVFLTYARHRDDSAAGPAAAHRVCVRAPADDGFAGATRPDLAAGSRHLG